MIDQEMLDALDSLVTRIVKTEVDEVRAEIKVTQQQTMQEVSKQIKVAQKQTMQDVATLMDAQFLKQFNLLADKLDGVMCKMPSEDDMDIIDGTLKEHDDLLKVHTQEIEQLKKAQ